VQWKSSIILIWAAAQAAGQVGSQDAPLPKFEDFKVTEGFKGAPATPILRTAHQRSYRTAIRSGAKNGPNFAGHYTIAQAGCGSDCRIAALVDVKSGDVFDQPFKLAAFPAMVKYIDSPEEFPAGMLFRVDSRLLIVHGCPEEGNCASYYLEWTGAGFKLLRKIGAVGR
jgi:hypothetical protein